MTDKSFGFGWRRGVSTNWKPGPPGSRTLTPKPPPPIPYPGAQASSRCCNQRQRT